MKSGYCQHVAAGVGIVALALGCGGANSDGDGSSSDQSPVAAEGSSAGGDATAVSVPAPPREEQGPIIGESEDLPGSATPAAGADSCIELDVQAERVVPTLLLLLDQSGSMVERFGDSTRWDTLRDILVDPDDGVIPRFEQDIEFGIATYTSIDGNTHGGECPIVETLPIGPVTAQTASDFLGSLSTVPISIDFILPFSVQRNCQTFGLFFRLRSVKLPYWYRACMLPPLRMKFPCGTVGDTDCTLDLIEESISDLRKRQNLPTLSAGKSPRFAIRSTTLTCTPSARETSSLSSKGSIFSLRIKSPLFALRS